ncbi:MAG TPA: hypothetical protein PKW41_13455 [Clostridia bacterium]|nr:hypothetical protein [Clostridia bacterium]
MPFHRALKGFDTAVYITYIHFGFRIGVPFVCAVDDLGRSAFKHVFPQSLAYPFAAPVKPRLAKKSGFTQIGVSFAARAFAALAASAMVLVDYAAA